MRNFEQDIQDVLKDLEANEAKGNELADAHREIVRQIEENREERSKLWRKATEAHRTENIRIAEANKI